MGDHWFEACSAHMVFARVFFPRMFRACTVLHIGQRWPSNCRSRQYWIPKTDIRARFPNILSKNEVFVSWIWIDFQNFLYNKALRFCLEGSGIFLNLNSSRYKELEMSQGLVYMSILYIIRGKESSESPKQTSGQGFRTYFRKMNVWFHGFGSIFKTFYITRRCASIWRGPGFFWTWICRDTRN